MLQSYSFDDFRNAGVANQRITLLKKFDIQEDDITDKNIIDTTFLLLRGESADIESRLRSVQGKDDPLTKMLYEENKGKHEIIIQDDKKHIKGEDVEEGSIQCKNYNCNSFRVAMEFQQTKGSDEAQTVFYKCAVCHEKWQT